MASKLEYVIVQRMSFVTGAPMGAPYVVHQNLVMGDDKLPCKGIVTRYSYADAVRLERKIRLVVCPRCNDYHT